MGGCVAFGLALWLYGYLSTNVGFLGLINQIILWFSVFLLGIGFSMSAPVMIIGGIEYFCTADRHSASNQLKNLLIGCLDLVVYGGTAFACLIAINKRTWLALAIVAIMIVLSVSYHFYKKKKVTIPDADSIEFAPLLFLFCCSFGVAGLLFGWPHMTNAIADAVTGPATAACRFVGYYSEEEGGDSQYAINKEVLVVVFNKRNGADIELRMNKGNSKQPLKTIHAAKGRVILTYYPRSGVYIAAKPQQR